MINPRNQIKFYFPHGGGNLRDAFIATSCRISKRLVCRDRSDYPRERRSLQRDTAKLTSEMCAKGILMSNIETDKRSAQEVLQFGAPKDGIRAKETVETK